MTSHWKDYRKTDSWHSSINMYPIPLWSGTMLASTNSTNHKHRPERRCVQSCADQAFPRCWLLEQISTCRSATWPHKADLSWVDPRVVPATPPQKIAKNQPETTWRPPNAKRNHKDRQHLGKEEGKGHHDKDLNLEFMGIFNLKKRSEIKTDHLNWRR